jgi:phosphoribosylglycinamide formyltransferase-1
MVSGSGSNLQSLIDACVSGEIAGRIVAVVSSKPGVYALERAKNAGIPTYVFGKKNYPSPETMYGEITALFKSLQIDLIVLAGYLGILTANIINEYKNKIINIHPSLIPSFCGDGYYGIKVHRAAIDYGCKVSGATVHFVDEGTDTGPIILQKAVRVLQNDTPEKLQKRVLKTEHKLLAEAVKLFCEDKIIYSGSKTLIKK